MTLKEAEDLLYRMVIEHGLSPNEAANRLYFALVKRGVDPKQAGQWSVQARDALWKRIGERQPEPPTQAVTTKPSAGPWQRLASGVRSAGQAVLGGAERLLELFSLPTNKFRYEEYKLSMARRVEKAFGVSPDKAREIAEHAPAPVSVNGLLSVPTKAVAQMAEGARQQKQVAQLGGRGQAPTQDQARIRTRAELEEAIKELELKSGEYTLGHAVSSIARKVIGNEKIAEFAEEAIYDPFVVFDFVAGAARAGSKLLQKAIRPAPKAIMERPSTVKAIAKGAAEMATGPAPSKREEAVRRWLKEAKPGEGKAKAVRQWMEEAKPDAGKAEEAVRQSLLGSKPSKEAEAAVRQQLEEALREAKQPKPSMVPPPIGGRADRRGGVPSKALRPTSRKAPGPARGELPITENPANRPLEPPEVAPKGGTGSPFFRTIRHALFPMGRVGRWGPPQEIADAILLSGAKAIGAAQEVRVAAKTVDKLLKDAAQGDEFLHKAFRRIAGQAADNVPKVTIFARVGEDIITPMSHHEAVAPYVEKVRVLAQQKGKDPELAARAFRDAIFTINHTTVENGRFLSGWEDFKKIVREEASKLGIDGDEALAAYLLTKGNPNLLINHLEAGRVSIVTPGERYAINPQAVQEKAGMPIEKVIIQLNKAVNGRLSKELNTPVDANEFIEHLFSGYLRRVYAASRLEPEAIRAFLARGKAVYLPVMDEVGIERVIAALNKAGLDGEDMKRALVAIWSQYDHGAVIPVHELIMDITGALGRKLSKEEIRAIEEVFLEDFPIAKEHRELLMTISAEHSYHTPGGVQYKYGERRAFEGRTIEDPKIVNTLMAVWDAPAQLEALAEATERTARAHLAGHELAKVARQLGLVADKEVEGFVKIPNTIPVGEFKGKWVDPELAQIITQVSYFPKTKTQALLKELAYTLRSVLLAPIDTTIRNIAGNFILAHLNGIHPLELAAYIPEAIAQRAEFYRNGVLRAAKEAGNPYLVPFQSMTGHYDIEDQVLQQFVRAIRKNDPNPVARVAAAVGDEINKALRGEGRVPLSALRLFRASEEVMRLAIAMAVRDRLIARGVPAEKAWEGAVKYATHTLFDYEHLPSAIRFLREYGIAAFPAFSYYAIGRVARSLVERPQTWAAYAGTYRAMEAAAAPDEEEYRIRLGWAMPEYLKDGVVIASEKGDGKVLIYDISYMSPFGLPHSIGQTFGDIIGGGLYAPLIDVVAALATGTGMSLQPQYRGQVFNPADEPHQRIAQAMAFLVNQYIGRVFKTPQDVAALAELLAARAHTVPADPSLPEYINPTTGRYIPWRKSGETLVPRILGILTYRMDVPTVRGQEDLTPRTVAQLNAHLERQVKAIEQKTQPIRNAIYRQLKGVVGGLGAVKAQYEEAKATGNMAAARDAALQMARLAMEAARLAQERELTRQAITESKIKTALLARPLWGPGSVPMAERPPLEVRALEGEGGQITLALYNLLRSLAEEWTNDPVVYEQLVNAIKELAP